MATDSLQIFGTSYTGVTGIKATDSSNGTKTYIRPQGTKSIIANGTGIDVTEYASVDVSVSGGSSPTLQAKTNITPTTSSQTITPDTGYDGLSSVQVNGDANLVAGNIKNGTSIFGVTGSYTGSGVTLQTKTNISPTESSQTIEPDTGYDGLSSVQINAISSTYVGSGITSRSSSDLTSSNATVTVPAGYYASQATKSIATGSVGIPSTITGTSASVSTGTNTLTLSKSVQVSALVTEPGYISTGSTGNSNVSLTASVTTKAAATITPGTTDQTIASGTYLTGAQTISGDANLVAGNIISGKSIFGVSGSVVIQHYYTGSSAPSSSTGEDGDIYLKTS